MGHSEEISRRLSALKQSAQDFLQMMTLIDGNFDGKMAEIRTLETKAEKLRGECESAQRRATEILQKAVEEAAAVNKESRRNMENAVAASQEAREEQERAKKMQGEAQALYQQAVQKNAEANSFWRQLEDRKKKIEEAVRG